MVSISGRKKPSYFSPTSLNKTILKMCKRGSVVCFCSVTHIEQSHVRYTLRTKAPHALATLHDFRSQQIAALLCAVTLHNFLSCIGSSAIVALSTPPDMTRSQSETLHENDATRAVPVVCSLICSTENDACSNHGSARTTWLHTQKSFCLCILSK